ncbi:MAG: hypothetical protein CVU47_06945 [Chloroflexi bacterium HGW-Chloroflexi-9]|nr:MAG: hypothetical protein CVU47_06945 [Chloroflexi bacterium HGW-Chloroflexi-9]
MTYDCHVERREAQPILGIQAEMTTPEEFGPKVGAAYGRLYAYAGAKGATPGMPMMIVRDMGPPMLLEIAIAVTPETPGDGDILASALPAGDVVTTLHIGPYDTIGAAYEAVFAYAGQHGRQPAGAPYETYLTDPDTEPDPAKYRSEVCLPVA